MLLNYKSFGEGQPLIVLHGLFGSLDNWVTLGKKFGERHKVYLVDQRNHGQSFHADSFSYEVMAEDLCQFMGELGILKAHIIGHSMGGKTAMEFTRQYPEKVDKLLVADIGPKFYPVHHSQILKAFYSVPIASLSSRKEADDILANSISDFGIRQFLLKNLSRGGEGFSWKMNLDTIANNIEEVGKALNQNALIKNKTLFLRGGNSDYILNDDFNLIHSVFPNSKVDTIDGAGHWLHAEKPSDFYQKASEFLS
ncbi:alpha/beta fold hydrolase [Roseivirga sp. E12]|uniref:alpha/beta fold hydrolase n=1 Tax=Roseivirga sp. E12 TaxID=2819237 RepID=UPI001ABCDD0D|nr:alpha/beta fold hydrolase [Roseivirga sp. E12]MBO3698939.1 alpha/beta fold hydrolase [Roseivirga sp. E12]